MRKEEGGGLPRGRHLREASGIIAVAIAVVALFAALAPAYASAPEDGQGQAAADEPPGVQECLACHSNPMAQTLPSGEQFSLQINRDAFGESVHGEQLVCSDCHTGITSASDHPQRAITSARKYTLSQYELCKRCHFSNYARTLDSVHYNVLVRGDTAAPVCVDCHGSHYIQRPDQPRAAISRTCSQCHNAIFETYADSVHGRALIDDNNQDVPVCTTCHGSHNVRDPLTSDFRLEMPQLCGDCHANRQLMGKYGISSNVLKTYLQDFHGASISLRQENEGQIAPEAVCSDCHGVHDITRPTDANSPVLKANLSVTCQKCHEGATPQFSNAWLGHYEPTLHKATLVYFVKWFYRIFIPFVLVGMTLHIILDVFRVITNR